MSLNRPEPGPDLEALYEEQTVPPPRLSLIGFIVPVLLVAITGIGALLYYRSHVQHRQAVARFAKTARQAAAGFDLPSLLAADQAGRSDPALSNDANALVHLALVTAGIAQHGTGVPGASVISDDRWAEAEALYERGADADNSVARAVGAYLDIARGQPQAAETALLDRGGAPIVAHALGWAQAERGAFDQGLRTLRAAIQRDFSAVAYRLTAAEYLHRNGDLRGALAQLTAATGERGNPKLLLARAWAAALQPQVRGAYRATAAAIAEIEKNAALAGPRTLGLLAWAKAEQALAVADTKGALEHVAEAERRLGTYPPLADLRARVALVSDQRTRAIQLLETAGRQKPTYRGLQWRLAEVFSERRDDQALALIEALEKTAPTESASYDLFRAEHHLRKGQLRRAKARFTAAAGRGEESAVLFGLARVAVEEEKRKGRRADFRRAQGDLETAANKRSSFPEAFEYVGRLQVTNGDLRAAHENYRQAERDFIQENRPIPEVSAFYDRVVRRFAKAKGGRWAQRWQQRKQRYLTSITADP